MIYHYMTWCWWRRWCPNIFTGRSLSNQPRSDFSVRGGTTDCLPEHTYRWCWWVKWLRQSIMAWNLHHCNYDDVLNLEWKLQVKLRSEMWSSSRDPGERATTEPVHADWTCRTSKRSSDRRDYLPEMLQQTGRSQIQFVGHDRKWPAHLLSCTDTRHRNRLERFITKNTAEPTETQIPACEWEQTQSW